MKKEQMKELQFQPIGRTKGGWVSSAEKRLELETMVARRNLVFAVTVAAAVIIDAIVIVNLF
ncbi:MAG: hypothetical protein IKM86_04710 [Acidaminococcaceae bacterium]|nr:hypothetical protein [Acidaminococcaceae bacterium]